MEIHPAPAIGVASPLMKQAQGALFSALGEACNFITSENASQPEVSVIAAAPASPGDAGGKPEAQPLSMNPV